MSAQAAAAPVGRQVRGPSALGGDVPRFFHLTWTLAVTDFKLRFFGSVLGYFWQLMRPVLMFGVLYVVFTEFVRVGNDVQHYGVVLITGLILFTFFADATGAAVSSVVDRENLVRKIHFPRLVIPLSVVLTAFFNLVLNLGLIFIVVLASGIEPRLSWLEVPLLVAALAGLATGISMLLSALYVRFRDVAPVWDVITQILFYGTPILYAIETIPENIANWIMLSPVATILQEMRNALIDPNAPGAASAQASPELVLVPIAIGLGLFALGFWVFNREAPRIAEEL